MESEKTPKMVRVVPDAVVGAGMVLRAGQLIPAEKLGRHLDSLLGSGAVEWAASSDERITLQ